MLCYAVIKNRSTGENTWSLQRPSVKRYKTILLDDSFLVQLLTFAYIY